MPAVRSKRGALHFLDAGLIDEISLLIVPVADGHSDVPTTFDKVKGGSLPLRLMSMNQLEGGIVHLRYSVH
jgi:riboflavin biosynthesis pyrimidine reductase